MTVSFSGRSESVTDVFGSGKLTPSEMTKKLWNYVKGKNLMKK
jgi:chromatin remodeling complex protein RSC6